MDYNKKKSKWRKVNQGVPQGGVLSPMLLNIYMSELPLPPKDINTTSYADDITLTTSHPQFEKLRDILTPYLITLHGWLESRKLKLAAEKSSAAVFTTRNKEAKSDPHLTINTSPIPVKCKVKYWVLPLIVCSILENIEEAPKRNYKSAVTL